MRELDGQTMEVRWSGGHFALDARQTSVRARAFGPEVLPASDNSSAARRQYRPGRGARADELGRIGRSRFDTLFGRLQAGAEWADRVGLCAHVLRHHAYALIERDAGGTRVAEKFARHRPDRLSLLYGQASTAEVALAIVELHGGTHPLVDDVC